MATRDWQEGRCTLEEVRKRPVNVEFAYQARVPKNLWEKLLLGRN